MDMADETLARQLQAGIKEMGLEIDAQKQDVLLRYLGLLIKWNKAYNLTGISDPAQMVSLNLLDSLTVLPFLTAQVVLDVGTGAGLPGIPLAICRPDLTFILLDSNGKKTRFLFQAVTTLGLKNVEVVNRRAENFQTERQIDIVVSRAFSSLRQTLDWTAPVLGEHTRLLAMKGQYPEDELACLPVGFELATAVSVSIPGQECNRHVLELIRTGIEAEQKE